MSDLSTLKNITMDMAARLGELNFFMGEAVKSLSKLSTGRARMNYHSDFYDSQTAETAMKPTIIGNRAVWEVNINPTGLFEDNQLCRVSIPKQAYDLFMAGRFTYIAHTIVLVEDIE